VNKRRRDALVAGLIALVAGLVFALPQRTWLDGLSVDLLFALRERVAPASHGDSPAVVIAIDEETYRREPFKDVPRAMWTPQLAKVINATLDGGAKVIGFDVIYSTSIEGSIRGYERDWLLALRRGAKEHRIVLGKVQHQAEPILPHVGALRIVGEDNVRSLHALEDRDGIIRRMPLLFSRPDGSREPSMALELAQRATGANVAEGSEGVRFGDYLVPGSSDRSMAVRFAGGVIDVPTYSLADLHACIEKGDSEYFRRAFQNKIVLIGAVLDLEDRKLTAKRWITSSPSVQTGRCALPVMPGVGDGSTVKDREEIAGVYLHAAAISNLIHGNALRHVAPTTRILATAGFSLIAGVLAFTLAPWIAGLAAAGLGVLWVAVATVGFVDSLVLPLLPPLLAGVAAFGLLWGYRFAVADRDKRFVRGVFEQYLAPAVVDQLVKQQKQPDLGGETRELTVCFSDIAGFTRIAERIGDPHKLVDFMNQYLSEMSDIVMAHGGIIDKYLGDGIVAVFGAPLADLNHAANAVESALACQLRLSQIQGTFGLPPDMPVRARIGVNTGEMLVGNIGSRKKKDYTVMGDAANTAARIEGVNKAYGTLVLVSDVTRNACADAVAFREIDTVRVVGRGAPLTLFQPMTHAQAQERAGLHAAYAEALASYRAGDFDAAVRLFARIADQDPPATFMLARCRDLQQRPLPDDWDAVYDLESK
jgi:adenylate cyclase